MWEDISKLCHSQVGREEILKASTQKQTKNKGSARITKYSIYTPTHEHHPAANKIQMEFSSAKKREQKIKQKQRENRLN